MVFRQYSHYLKEKYGETVYRIAVDAGFSCPNRGSDRTNPGCSYCDDYGVRSAYIGEDGKDMEEQVRRTMAVLKTRYKAHNYILYFQAYSSTWKDPSQLKKIYDHGLSLGNFVEMVISTRPDCIDREIAGLLSSYIRPDFDVWVELGLQSSHDCSLERINRGHNLACFRQAFGLLRQAGVKIAVHLIFGLPGEDWKMMMESVEYLGALKPEGIKFHNLHIPASAPLYREYELGELAFPDSRRHAVYVADAIERLPEDCIVMRITTDTPVPRNKTPGAFLNKSSVYNMVRNELERRGSRQGRLWIRKSDPGGWAK